ncbi:MAG TPA: hypothetical protein PLI13_11105 [Paracoccus sp. (in: a-proteobacteria)]|nr:hypothetical protein [Paracoccus sp. (in: a-proteobacteria)]
MPMMEPSEFSGAVPVDGYGPGFFRVAGTVHQGPVIVTASGARPWGGTEDIAALLALVALGGNREVYGLANLTNGPLDS